VGSQTPTRVDYFDILALATDPQTLRVGILFSDLFSDDVKEMARQATSVEALRRLLGVQRSRVSA